MRPAEFTPEAIIQAGQDLQAAGRNITGFALRQRVGGGNPSRLKQVWDEHLATQSITEAAPVAELPVEVAEEMATVTKALTERLGLLAIELNDKAVKAAERRVGEVVRAAGEQREQAERELADASQTVDELETKLDDVTAHVEDLEKHLAEALSTSQAQAVELAQLRERLAASDLAAKTANEQHTGELARHQQEAEQLRADLARVHVESNARERIQVEEAAKTKAEIERLSSQLHDQKTRSMEVIGKLEKDKQKLEGQLIDANKEARDVAGRSGKVVGELEALRAQVAAQADLIKGFATGKNK